MSDMVVKVRADRLQPGQRFVFAEGFGGQSEVLTVDTWPEMWGGVASVYTEEYGELMFPANEMIEIKTEED